MLRPSFLVFLIGACSVLSVLAVDSPVVDTSAGKVRGNQAESREGKKYYQFLGIPFAKADRFQPPTKPDAWTDIRDATAFGPVCPQLDLKLKNNENPKVVGDENCLNVNVYTPRLPQSGAAKVLLPVIVWFESGGFIVGSGNYYGANYFMDTDVILVTVNSRKGLLGFLNVGDAQASGNQGLKDQVAALQWVQENIEHFGGDKARVTIAGHGSGAASVHYHLLSPKSTGLFSNAISQTGANLAPWAFMHEPVTQAKTYAATVGCPVDTKDALIQCLKTKKVDELIPKDYKYIEFSGKERNQFEPSAETTSTGGEFITHNPAVLMAQGKVVNKVPLIIGVAINDGAVPPVAAYLANPEYLTKLNKNWDEKVPIILDYKKTASDSAVVSKKIKDYYFEGKDVTPDSRFRLTDIIADRFFFGPALNFAIKYSGIAPTFTYCITYQGQYSNFQLEGLKLNGSAYYDDLQYEFPLKQYDVPEITKGASDFDFSNKFVKLWSSFAENGKPTKTWGPNTVWDKFDPAKAPLSLYGIDAENKPFVIPEDMLKRHALWGELRTTVLKAEEEDPPKETF